MPAPLEYASSPISISSGMPSPQAILISSDSSPARGSDALSFSQAPYWLPAAANLHVPLGATGFGSHGSVVSRSSVPTQDLGAEYELVRLREQCGMLRTENAELKGRVEALT
jgi:hypothetical protein